MPKPIQRPLPTVPSYPSTPTIKHPKIEPVLYLRSGTPYGPLTVEFVKHMLGWTEVTDGDYLFIDYTGAKIKLTKNARNRPFTFSRARKYAQEFLNRNWADSGNGEGMSINGEPFIISLYDNVLSGQHRGVGFLLAEQIRQGHGPADQRGHWSLSWNEPLTMEALIVYGVSEDPRVVRTIDTTAPRMLSDALYTSGLFDNINPKQREVISRMLSNAIRMLWSRTRACDNPYSPNQTHSESLDFLERHPKLIEAAKHIWSCNGAGKINRFMSAGYATALMYLMGTCKSDINDYLHADPAPHEGMLNLATWELAEEFWKKLAEQDGALKPLIELRYPYPGDKKDNPIRSAVFPLKTVSAPLAIRTAAIIQAWAGYSKYGTVSEDDVDLEYEYSWDDKNELISATLKYHPCLLGIDQGEIGQESASVEVTEEEVEAIKAEINGAHNPPPQEDDPTEVRRRQVDGVLKRMAEKSIATPDQPSSSDKPSFADELADLKDKHNGKLLLFRSTQGTKYKAWGEDASVLSQLFKVPTEINTGMPLASFPANQLESNLTRLINAGYKVAICEQVEGETVVSDPPAQSATKSKFKKK